MITNVVTTCIGSKVDRQVAPLALVPNLATRLRNLHRHIALHCPIGIVRSIEFVSPSARVTSVKSTQGLSVTSGPKDGTPIKTHQPESHQLSLQNISETLGPIDRTPCIPLIWPLF